MAVVVAAESSVSSPLTYSPFFCNRGNDISNDDEVAGLQIKTSEHNSGLLKRTFNILNMRS